MPVETCVKGGKSGHRFGAGGFCFTGGGSQKKAADQGAAIKAENKKGVAGDKTGGPARRAIEAAIGRGCTTAQIAKAAKRSASVIGQIRRGEIKNPPAELVSAVVGACKGLKPPAE